MNIKQRKKKENNHLFIYVIEKNRKDRVQYFYSRYLVKINVVMTKGAFTYDVRCFLGIFDLPTYLKVSKFQKQIFLFSFEPKNKRFPPLASKIGQIKK